MIRQLIDVFSTLETPPTPDEISDALWLAKYLPAELAASSPLRAARDLSSQVMRVVSDAWPESGLADQFSGGVVEAALAATVHVAGGEVPLGEHDSAVAGRMPAVPALMGTRELSRALRPLRRRWPTSTAPVVDEAATAASIADNGLCYPRFRPGMERWLDLILLVDDSVSMAIWRRTLTEFKTLLQRLGAFRDLRMWHFDADATVGKVLMLRGESDLTLHSHRELLDSTRRRLILIVSDCIGVAWRSPTIVGMLEELSAAGPVAVLQPLPQRLWSRCGPPFVPVRFTASEPAQPNHAMRVTLRDPVAHVPPGVPIPVLELDPGGRWLAPWASLVAASGTASGTALFTGLMVGRDVAELSLGEAVSLDRDISAPDRLLRFRAVASPTAYLLASYLAAAPLTLPVMRLVQSVMMPESRPSHLAEVFLGGLLRRASEALDPEMVRYDFHDGVRELLIAGLARDDTLRVMYEVSRFVGPRLGSPSEFQALLAAGADEIIRFGAPFATVAYTTLRALGGHYADLAAKLEERIKDDQAAGSGGDDFVAPMQLRERDLESGPHLRDPEDENRIGQPRLGGPHAPGDDVTQSRPLPPTGPRQHLKQPHVWHGVPDRNPDFTGRQSLLDEIRSHLSRDVSVLMPEALHGLGGVGKTQVAIEFAHRFSTDYDLVWWINAEELTLIRASLTELASQLGLPIAEDTEQTARTVLEALRQGQPYPRWLLIFDNAMEPTAVKQYLPFPSGHTLITSRNREWESFAKIIPVGIFSRQESIDLIQLHAPGITLKDADRLADRLGDLPLALQQAATWQSETGMSVDEYIQLFETESGRLLSESLPASYTRPVAVTWRLAFDHLTSNAPAAAELLYLSAFFGPRPIRTSILTAGRLVPGLPSALSEATKDPMLLGRAIREIGQYALAVVARGSFQVHPLVQVVLRELSPRDRQEYWRNLVHQVLAAANPREPDKSENWPRLAEINEHVVKSVGLIEGEGVDVRQVIIDQIRYLYIRGDYASSRALGETTMQVWWERYGPNDELTLIACRHLANSWRALGMTEEARLYNRDTLERTRRVFGDDDERALVTANSYGADLRINGAYQDARDLDEDNWQRCGRVFGAHHRVTLHCANNVAVDLRLSGDFKGALAIDKDILERRLHTLGASDHETLFARCMIARDMRGCGYYQESLEIYHEVLGDFRELLGEEHRDVLNARLSYGATLQRSGQYERARTEIEESLFLLQRRFGAEHPSTIAAMTILASPLRLLGDVEGARSLAGRALAFAQNVHGADHLFTSLYANNAAIAMRALGQIEDARRLDERAFPRIIKAFGPDHVFTLSTSANIAHDVYLNDDFTAARKRSQDVLRRSRRVRGNRNPLTLVCAGNLAIDMRATDDGDEAEKLAGRSAKQLGDILGADNRVVDALRDGIRYEFDIEPPQL